MSTGRWKSVTLIDAANASRIRLIGAFLIVFCAFGLSAATAAERGRVRVQNGTVVSDRGTILRGAAESVLNGPGNTNNASYWQHLNVNVGLNAVRLDVKTAQIGRSIQQQLPNLDNAVNSAAKNNMYVMILSSNRAGRYYLDELRRFWSVVAPRYKNRTHVIYEMLNEPTSGGPHWGDASQFTDRVVNDLKSVYDIMRRGAPNTHIVLFSPGNIYPDCARYTNVIEKMRGIDWSKASVGFHHYNGTAKIGEAGLRCLKSKYPLIMTETAYWTGEPGRTILKDDLAIYEKLGISWFSLDGKGSTYYLQNEIIPGLRKRGYTWKAEK